MNATLADALSTPTFALLLKASILIAAAALAQVFLRRRASAATRHGVWTLAIATLLVLPVVSAIGPRWVMRVPAASSALPASGATAAAAHEPIAAAATQHGDPAFAGARITAGESSAPASPAWPWPAIAWSVYAAEALLLLGRLISGHVTARRLIRAAEEIRDGDWTETVADCARVLGVSRSVRVLRSASQVMPMVSGVRRPAILLPSDADAWNDERRRAVVLHELAHVARQDCFTQTLASLATALYWPHPGVWWAARRLQVEREFACDDRVLSAGATADEYASDLLEIAYTLGARRHTALGVTMARRRQLEGRLLAVMDRARNRATPGRRGRLAAGIATAFVLVIVAGAGITTRAAMGPLGLDDEVVPQLGAAGQAAIAATSRVGPDSAKRTPKRLPQLLYSWRDAAEQLLPTTGTWSLQPSGKPGEVYVELRQLHSSSGRTMTLAELQGLTGIQMTAGGPVKFTLRRDAGSFTFEGVIHDGAGGGTFSYTANPAFGDELAKRGVGRPTPNEQFEMAKHDVGLALVDELKAQGYGTPTIGQLVQAGHHGVTIDYVREMGSLGYKAGTIDALVTMRDHGVTPDFVRGLASAGLPKLSAEELVTTRDHGVTPEYIKELSALGYSNLTVDQLRQARDHGVTAEYVKELAALGYAKLSLEEVRNLRDHGVTADYVKGLAALGYSKLSPEEARNARDHGVTPEYVKEMAALGYSNLSLDEVRNLRDHGVTPDYVKQLAALGYAKLPAEEVRNARDHGVTPEYVRGLKDLGYSQLSLDELIKLRDHGATPDRVKRANDKAGAHLSPEMLRTVMDGGLR